MLIDHQLIMFSNYKASPSILLVNAYYKFSMRFLLGFFMFLLKIFVFLFFIFAATRHARKNN